jgi:hypothetical protein
MAITTQLEKSGERCLQTFFNLDQRFKVTVPLATMMHASGQKKSVPGIRFQVNRLDN